MLHLYTEPGLLLKINLRLEAKVRILCTFTQKPAYIVYEGSCLVDKYQLLYIFMAINQTKSGAFVNMIKLIIFHEM